MPFAYSVDRFVIKEWAPEKKGRVDLRPENLYRYRWNGMGLKQPKDLYPKVQASYLRTGRPTVISQRSNTRCEKKSESHERHHLAIISRSAVLVNSMDCVHPKFVETLNLYKGSILVSAMEEMIQIHARSNNWQATRLRTVSNHGFLCHEGMNLCNQVSYRRPGTQVEMQNGTPQKITYS